MADASIEKDVGASVLRLQIQTSVLKRYPPSWNHLTGMILRRG